MSSWTSLTHHLALTSQTHTNMPPTPRPTSMRGALASRPLPGPPLDPPRNPGTGTLLDRMGIRERQEPPDPCQGHYIGLSPTGFGSHAPRDDIYTP
jgi:hypothetical protein